MFVDDVAEYRLLASVIDRPDSVLAYTPELFTNDRERIFKSMRDAYLAFGEISTEGVEKFYGRMLPPEIESARGAKPGAVLDRLITLADRRQLSNLINNLTVALSSNQTRDQISPLLALKPVMSVDDSSLAPGITTFTSDLHRKLTHQYRFVRTGLDFLDHMMGGEWPRQAITIMMAQSGGGKTALVAQSMLNMARQGIASLFISLEMPKDRLISRMAANLSGVDGKDIRSGNISDEDQKRVNIALEEIQSLDRYMFIVDRTGMDVHEIQHHVRLHKEAHNIEAFFVDYLQIVNPPDNLDDVAGLGYVTQQLRNIAMSLDIAAIALTQKNGMEGLQSVWGSRRIVHIADTIFEIKMDASSTNDESRLCTIDFIKNRDGPLGTASCLYRPKYLRFE